MHSLNTTSSLKDVVIFVHGLWMTGVDMFLLRRRVQRCGFHVHQFSYPSIRRGVFDNAAGLTAYIASLDGVTIHLVGHSLGGLVIRQCLHDLRGTMQLSRIGRAVTLGTPHQGSAVARRLGQNTWLGCLVGKSIGHGLDGDLPPWPPDIPLGVIAGTMKIGVGQIFGGYPGRGDGTVAVEEARIDAMTDFICLPVTHTGMQFSADVARQVCCFLRDGHFDHSH